MKARPQFTVCTVFFYLYFFVHFEVDQPFTDSISVVDVK